MKLLSHSEFDKVGGLTIGIGAKNCLYTLRNEYWDQLAMSAGPGLPPDVRLVRRSHHWRNLGKDWAEVAARLPEVLLELGFGEDAGLFVPGHCDGKLDPNKAPDAAFIPTEVIPFGVHVGKTIDEVLQAAPDYIFYLAENYHPNEERARGRWMAFLRDYIAHQLDERRLAREAAAQERKRAAEHNRVRFAPLAAFLRAQSRHEGDFCAGMAKHFEGGESYDALAPRAAVIVAEVWAKAHGGRKGSAKFEAALAQFEAQFGTNEAAAAA